MQISWLAQILINYDEKGYLSQFAYELISWFMDCFG